MVSQYIIGIDQSTQGTKALLFNEQGALLRREDMPHRQIVNEQGWVSHDPEEIFRNTIEVVKRLIENSGVPKEEIKCVGISNQRETALAWNRDTGIPVADAIVWQCSRAKEICAGPEVTAGAEAVFEKTGLKLSPYFPAAKLAWLLEKMPGAKEAETAGNLCMGTIDTWLVYKLTGRKSYKTDYSNASRTQLFNIHTLEWDETLCSLFGIHKESLAEVCDSDACFGETDFQGILPHPIPIHSVLGDSHAALFGQGCEHTGMVKATYGTGSSIMMNTGEKAITSHHGVVTSLGWKRNGTVNYVLEGNINYTGAVISWLKDQVRLIDTPGETESLCEAAIQNDSLYFIPAFTGLGAPYWDSSAQGILSGITRTTRKEEIVRAAVESIAYQIRDIVDAMSQDAGMAVTELRVDGGPTRNKYLMQFQCDILDTEVLVSRVEEMSGIGVAYAAGIACGIYGENIVERIDRKKYQPKMAAGCRTEKIRGWQQAVQMILGGK